MVRQATGVAGLYIDDHADDRQTAALPAIIGRRVGGFPGWVNECFVGGWQSRGPPGKYPQLINAPGSETGPGPQLVTWGKSTVLSVDAHGFKFEYTLNSAKHIPFDWRGP